MKLTLKSALVAAIALVSVPAFASNMGFKLVKPLSTTAAGVHTGVNWTSIPYFNSFATQTANGLWADLPVGKLNVFRYNPATGTFQRWAGGGPGQTDFGITEGESYDVRVNANVNWTIVGSHDNAFSRPLSMTSAGVHTGVNWTSIPYHTTSTLASGIWNSLPVGKLNVFRYNPATGTFQRWAGGGPGQTDFPVTIGEAYDIRVSANVTWMPVHY